MQANIHVNGFGKVCLNSALVIQLSWIPALGLLEGESWATPGLVGFVHFGGLAFMIAAPLAFGARLWFSMRKEDSPAIMKDWAVRCLLPPSLFAIAIQAVMRLAPHITIPVIIGLMIATLPLGVYGILLQREAAPAK